METRRATGATLVVGAIVLVAAASLIAAAGDAVKSGPWLVANGMFLTAAAVVWRHRSDRIALWFAAVGAAFGGTQLLDAIAIAVAADPDLSASLPWVALLHQLGITAASVVTAQFLGLFPDSRSLRRRERRTLRALWWLLALPPLLLLTYPTLLFPTYLPVPSLPNPYHLPVLEPLGTVLAAGVGLSQGAFAVGLVILVLRYRRGAEGIRQRIRWLLVPGVLTVFALGSEIVAVAVSPGLANNRVAVTVGGAIWIVALVALPTSVAIALTRPRLLDVDALLRRSLVYGFLWSLIAAVYVGAAAALGLAAGQRFPVEVAILLTVVATLAFQPARRRLERAADRWVFGERLGRYEALRRLGQTLEHGVDQRDLLQRLADTVQRGLRLSWVRVTADGADSPALEATAGEVPPDAEPTEVVPIVDAGEVVGHITCGTPSGRAVAGEDRELLEALARQAGLAVRTLRLTRELSDNVDALQRRTSELEESRARLVRVQEEERRRLERDLHDGVQQDVVALIGQVGLARRRLRRGETDEGTALADVQAELGRILSVLRELGRGIHPTVLTDRGLVEAVEAQAARSPVPVRVVADDAVRDERFRPDVEGAAFFTVCEALANVLKHAEADAAEVRLTRSDGRLRVRVSDAGRGFDQRLVREGGLRNLTERVEALGGRLWVESRPGDGTSVTAELVVNRAFAHG